MLRRVAALGLVAGAAMAQQVLVPPAALHTAITADSRGLTLPPGQITAIELIDAVSRYLCRNYLYEFDALSRVPPIELQRPLVLDAPGAEEVLLAALASRGFLALPIDETRGIYEVVDLGTPQRAVPVPPLPWREPDEILRQPRLRELVMTAVAVSHVDAETLAGAIRNFYSLQGMWQPGVPTASAVGPRLLLLYGFRDQLAQTIAVVQQIDRLSAPPPAPPRDELLQRIEALEREVRELRAERR